MNPNQFTRPTRALGLCSGGLDSILSALVLKDQGIDVTWVSFETPFFDSGSAQKAADQTGISLIRKDITPVYMEMMRAPQMGFGKNMNPCMDCHTLMFSQAARIMEKQGFDFLFSGEVMGQRPKSQTKNALRYVEKNSGAAGYIVRPLSARLLPITRAEQEGLVDRDRLLDISGRSRKIQMALAESFGITDYPAPAGGCLLTDKGFSQRLRDLLYVQKTQDPAQLYLLKSGRHFRLDAGCKLVVGRNQVDNGQLLAHFNPKTHIRLRHAQLPGPEALLFGSIQETHILEAARITAGYTKAKPGADSLVSVFQDNTIRKVCVTTPKTETYKDKII
jgi:tRNA U34 2-thiouridine synthase MnmA/TrmU